MDKLNSYINRAYMCAKKHGFHQKEHSMEYYSMLIITEAAEVIDADRHGRWAEMDLSHFSELEDDEFKDLYAKEVAGTVQDEMADIAIRILDATGAMKKTIGKWEKDIVTSETLVENCFDITIAIVNGMYSYAFSYMEVWAKLIGFDLFTFIDIKMRYNELRPMYNGKIY